MGGDLRGRAGRRGAIPHRRVVASVLAVSECEGGSVLHEVRDAAIVVDAGEGGDEFLSPVTTPDGDNLREVLTNDHAPSTLRRS